MRVLSASINYPDSYNHWGTWNKEANIAISQIPEIKMEVLVPRPFTLPFKWFKYHYFSKIPLCEDGIEGKIHHPRFPFLLPKRFFYPLAGDFYSFFIGNYVRKNIPDIDLIHAHHAYPDGYGLSKVCKEFNYPLVIDIHGQSFFSDWLQHPLLQKKIWKCVQNSSKIIVISKKLLSEAIVQGIPEQKLEYIPLGVNFKRFEKSAISDFSHHLKNEHMNKCIFLFVGHLTKRKGLKYLLQAVSRLQENVKNNCHFIIAGEGPEKVHLMNDAGSLNILNNFTFTGSLAENELLKLYSAADVFVLPSLSEGRPTVINEAMASECAIIASNVDGIPEQVTDGYNGFLVDPQNPGQLAGKIKQLAEDENLMRTMGKNSRRKIIDEGITWENYARKVVRVYHDSLNE